MSIRFFKNPYKKALEESAKAIAPKEETTQKILGTVMLAAGVTSAVSMASASAKAASLGKAAALKVAGSVVAVTVGVSVAGVAVFSPPAIKEIQVMDEGWTKSSIVVTTDSAVNTREVLILPEQGAAFPAEHEESTRYVASVYQNGLYTVEVTGQGGQTITGQVRVDGIDAAIPQITSYTTDSDSVTIFFSDDRSGVNWDTIRAVDTSGAAVTPLEINGEQGYVRFALPEANLDIYLEDMAGNKGMTTIYVS